MNAQVEEAQVEAETADVAEDQTSVAEAPAAEEADEVEINLPDMSYDNLEKVKEAVVAKQREQREKERAQDLNQIKALVGKHGLKWSDIKPEKAASKVAAKYRDPASGVTWSGRGKAPLWIRDHEDRTPFQIG